MNKISLRRKKEMAEATADFWNNICNYDIYAKIEEYDELKEIHYNYDSIPDEKYIDCINNILLLIKDFTPFAHKVLREYKSKNDM